MGEGGAVRFAAGDYFAAAKKPTDLLKQALQGATISTGAMSAPSVSGFGPAMMELSSAIRILL